MRVVEDARYNEAAEAAISRVLLAERAAREAVAEARREVERIVERGRLDARALDARTERRVHAVIEAFERDVAGRLATIEAAAEQVAHARPFSDGEHAALQRAVRAVAEELIAAPP
jgi:hypothetical protein